MYVCFFFKKYSNVSSSQQFGDDFQGIQYLKNCCIFINAVYLRYKYTSSHSVENSLPEQPNTKIRFCNTKLYIGRYNN